jgi:hypothetical protein
MLDLPQPLGPTTPTNWPGSKKLVGSANDLKPESLMELRRTSVSNRYQIGWGSAQWASQNSQDKAKGQY